MARFASVDVPREILGKYREIKRLRELEEAGSSGDPREAMRALASAFPSALGELDRLPMATIEARVAELERVIRGESPVPGWVGLQLAVHDWLRLALRVKRAGGARRERERALEVFRGSPEADALGAVEADLDAMLAPPAGRLVPWVHARVARTFGVMPSAVAAAFRLESWGASSATGRMDGADVTTPASGRGLEPPGVRD